MGLFQIATVDMQELTFGTSVEYAMIASHVFVVKVTMAPIAPSVRYGTSRQVEKQCAALLRASATPPPLAPAVTLYPPPFAA